MYILYIKVYIVAVQLAYIFLASFVIGFSRGMCWTFNWNVASKCCQWNDQYCKLRDCCVCV